MQHGCGLFGVVINDRANTDGAVDHCQPQHDQIPDLPEQEAHLPATSPKFRPYAVADHEVGEQVRED